VRLPQVVDELRPKAEKWDEVEAERVPQGLWPYSSVLSRLAEGVRSEFVGKLSREWLPDKRFELLYRGSRDGMTAAAFHDKCDGKGPTLVLVAGQSEGQPVCVFGGYAGKSWERGPESLWKPAKAIDARDSFLFTVLNPFGDGIVRIAVNEGSRWADRAMLCHAGLGPVFSGGFGVTSIGLSSTATFDSSSNCGLIPAGAFGDPLDRGYNTFTGSQCFTPCEVEVWRVSNTTIKTWQSAMITTANPARLSSQVSVHRVYSAVLSLFFVVLCSTDLCHRQLPRTDTAGRSSPAITLCVRVCV
jgi:hypothetical protein